MDYCLTSDGLVRFRDKIYVLDSSELKKVSLREFHVKPYSHHSNYQKTLTVMNKFYYFPNMRKDIIEFVARCFDCQRVKANCKHLGGLIHLIMILEWKWDAIPWTLSQVYRGQ